MYFFFSCPAGIDHVSRCRSALSPLKSLDENEHCFEMRGLKIKTVTSPAEFKCQENMSMLETFPGSL
jgi:hypothetical protein